MIEYFKEKDIQARGIGLLWTDRPEQKIRNIWLHYHNSQISMEELQHRRRFADALDIPVGFDTDVNGSALG